MPCARDNVALDGYFVKAPPYKDEPPLETMMANVAVGDPHQVAEVLVEAIKVLGTTHLGCFMLYPSVTGKEARRSMDLFAEKVVPLMEKALGRPLARGECGAGIGEDVGWASVGRGRRVFAQCLVYARNPTTASR